MRQQTKPRLLFFYSATSGRCRRAEGFLAQVLQRRRNHETFEVVRVPVDERAELADRLRVVEVPTFLVLEDRRVRARMVAPRGFRDLEAFLRPWLRQPVEAHETDRGRLAVTVPLALVDAATSQEEVG